MPIIFLLELPDFWGGRFEKKNYFIRRVDRYSGLYLISDLAIAKDWDKSLLVTAISASFLDFPLATSLSYKALHCRFFWQAVKLHKNKWFRIRGLPLFDILDFPLTLVPDVVITGERPKKADNCLAFSKVWNPLEQTINKIAVLLPKPGMDKRFDNNPCSCFLTGPSSSFSSRRISDFKWRTWRFNDVITLPFTI